MKTSECFEKGLLRKSFVDTNRANGSISISKSFVNKSEKNLEIEQFDVALLMAYNAMFHTARSLLFRGGITERSHFCMVSYLKDNYKDNALQNYFNLLDTYRIIRQNIQYRGEWCTKIDAEQALADAKDFLREVRGKYFQTK